MKAASLVLASLAFLTPVPASAMTYYLTKQWFQNGSQMCQYSNGTVLNMGIKLCPLSIQG